MCPMQVVLNYLIFFLNLKIALLAEFIFNLYDFALQASKIVCMVHEHVILFLLDFITIFNRYILFVDYLD